MITGETGAGKSLLIDALGLALGARADPGLVRHDAPAARVEALFDRVPEPLVCVREVAASGRSVARLDDETVTAGRLAATVGPLVEIHGQHEQARLLDERWQRDLLDAFGGLEAERAAVSAAVGAWRENEAARAAIAVEPRELERRIALVEHEASEIAAARIRPGEVTEIRARLAASRHGESIARGGRCDGRAARWRRGRHGDARRARAGGAGGGRGRGPGAARRPLRAPGRPPGGPRRGAGGRGLRDADNRGRGGARPGCARGHGGAALLPLHPRTKVRDRLRRAARTRRARGGRGGRLRGLEGEGTAGPARRPGCSRPWRPQRRRSRLGAARRPRELGAGIERALGDLGLGGTGVEIAVGRRPAGRDEPAVEVDGDAVAFDATGIDVVVFLIAPNPGEPARPLARIASGGELSRVALAIEEVLVEADATPTLVFDEIDAGIGGRSADPVGRTLVGPRRPPPGPVRDAPAADRGPRRCPLRDPQGAARRSHRDRGPSPRRRGAGAGAGRDARRRGRRAGVRGVGPRAARAGRPVPGEPRRPARPARDAGGRSSGSSRGARSARSSGRFRGTLPLPPRRSSSTCASSAASLPRRSKSYGSDLAAFGRSPGAAEWGSSHEAAIDYLAGLAGATDRSGRVLRTTSLRRRTAALRSFYRFALAEELVAVGRREPPGPAPRAADPAGPADRGRGGPAAGRRGPRPGGCRRVATSGRARARQLRGGARGAPRPGSPRAALCRRAPRQRGARPRRRRPGPRRRERARRGEGRSRARGAGWRRGHRLAPPVPRDRAPGAGRRRSRAHGPRRPRLPVRSRAAPRPEPRLVRGEAGGRRSRPGRARLAPHPPPLLRDAPPRGRRRPARRTGVARVMRVSRRRRSTRT